ncbi:MAG: ECF transporter S component [Clostridia bacterium]|nr:ECF transporter S component [Clostridia bacterium]
MKNKTQKIVLSSLLAALICVATMIIKIQTFKGYINLGDCVVLLSGWILSPMYAFLTAGVGSLLADIFSGYVIYAPVTFLIKGFMALICCYGLKLFKKKPFVSRITSGILAEIVMVGGYYIFEGFMYGFIASAVNIPLNAIQGIVGIILGIMLVKIFKKSDIVN